MFNKNKEKENIKDKSIDKKAEKKSDKPKSQLKINAKILGGKLLIKMAVGGAAQLRSNADEVNKLNVFPVPDGDTGDNMRMTIESGIAAIENLESDDLAEVMKALSHGMLLGARGNSGVILSQFFAGIAKGLQTSDTADALAIAHALELGVEQAYASVMTPTEGTILTVAREAVEYAVSRIDEHSTVRTVFADLVKEMNESLERTPEILPVLKEAGVVDSGGAGLLYIMDGFNRVLNGEEIASEPVPNKSKSSSVDTSAFNADSVMTFGYCTELLLQLQRSKTDIENFDIEPLKAFLCDIGDSVVAFKTESIVKLHVHTFTPERVLEYCRQYGEFLTVKIENMSLQHTTLEEKGEAPGKPAKAEPKKKYGIVAVGQGPGVESLFLELGTDEIVHGGQTQNPSTNDFLDAFAKVWAEHIFVFPNNGNILMAASQAAELYEDAQVHVIPSKNIGSGYAALSSANLDAATPDEIINDALEAMGRVTTGFVSPSIRDADMNGIHINEGDTIGIIDKEIVVADADKSVATNALASKLMNMPGKFMLTVFSGKDASDEENQALEAYVTSEFPDAEVYFIDGGQDIYPYIFVAE
jgi:DAK2 domain fusion protein YloV